MAPTRDGNGRHVRSRDAVAGRSAWVRFVRRFGWRAYALPILTVITVAALARSPGSGHTYRAGGTGTGRGSATTAPALGTGAASGTRFEGFRGSDAGYRAGSTPAPVVVNLGADETSCATNRYPQLLLVSISKQHLWACEGARQVNATAVTTGNVVHHDQTPVGSWRVQAKQRDRYLVGPGYKDYVRYWVPFNGDFGLHDASWQTMPFGSPHWRTQGSHGCVHTPTRVMAWIYRWVRPGRTVVTVEA